jgi:ABC-type transporter Mla MlaB component
MEKISLKESLSRWLMAISFEGLCYLMLKITTHAVGPQAILEIEGSLTGPWVAELKECWQRAVVGSERVTVVLKQVSYVDRAGRTILAEMYRQGVELTAEGCMITAIIEEIKEGERR